MEEILKILQEIRDIGEVSNPVIQGLAEKAMRLVSENHLYTKEEVLNILDRRDGIEVED